MNNTSASRNARFLFAALLATLSCSWSRAEMFTLTDKQGRSIKADVLSLTGDQVKIKRDDGQTFNLSLATLAEDDQKKLKKWAEDNPPPVDPNDVVLQFSRAKFDSERKNEDGYTAYKEEWGYGITLTNKSRSELRNVRAEYILFVKQDSAPGAKDADTLRKVKNVTKFDPIPSQAKADARTATITSYRYVLTPGFQWARSGGSTKPIRDTLEGMWLRIYVGDKLLLERVTPETLAKTEKW